MPQACFSRTLTTTMLFKNFLLSDNILTALHENGYVEPTAIQAKAIPVILERKDVLASAQTGTGKTAAFVLPLLQLLSSDSARQSTSSRIRSLILTPTRELALQIDANIAAYARHLTLRHHVIFGGVTQHRQVQQLAGSCDILVATPGRLLDLMQQGYVNLSHVTYFVLDEADRMLDAGFLNDVTKIIRSLPAKKQTLLFSATVPPAIKKLADGLLKHPVYIAVHPVSSTAEKIIQYVYHIDKSEKHDLLVDLLKDERMDRVLVFTTMKHHADKIAKQLARSGISSEAIHGNKTQRRRQEILSGFKNGNVRVLIATDIVARGIDIDHLSHVVNYELPDVPETYVHRIGRTGRKGNVGTAISFCSPDEQVQLKDIQRLLLMPLKVASSVKKYHHHAQ
jgi:ATP-dependent RNA helicase RhlE